MTNAIKSKPAAGPMAEADLATEAGMLEFFRSALTFPSVSGNEREFVHFVAEWGRQQGFQADLWQADEAVLSLELAQFPRHLSLE